MLVDEWLNEATTTPCPSAFHRIRLEIILPVLWRPGFGTQAQEKLSISDDPVVTSRFIWQSNAGLDTSWKHEQSRFYHGLSLQSYCLSSSPRVTNTYESIIRS